jgi:hypothetical protein
MLDVTALQAENDQLRARVAELESKLAVKARKPRRVAGDPCQYCGDSKTDKITFLGLPMCSDWKPCAGRMRRAKGIPGYAWDRCYSVTQQSGKNAPWVARFNGEVIGIGPDRGAMRRLAYDHRNNAVLARAA